MIDGSLTAKSRSAVFYWIFLTEALVITGGTLS